jgi:hypothetical protein
LRLALTSDLPFDTSGLAPRVSAVAPESLTPSYASGPPQRSYVRPVAAAGELPSGWMLGRRFLLVVAVLMGLTALAASVAPRERTVRSGPQAERAQPAPSASTGVVTLQTIRREISADATGQRIVVGDGDLLALEVTGSEREAVRMLGEIDVVAPSTPARFHIVADQAGEHAIELVGSERRIGMLVVR